MRTVTIKVNFGGFIGAEKTLQFDVPDDYSNDDIDDMAQEEFENFINGECTWEIDDIEDEEEEETW